MCACIARPVAALVRQEQGEQVMPRWSSTFNGSKRLVKVERIHTTPMVELAGRIGQNTGAS